MDEVYYATEILQYIYAEHSCEDKESFISSVVSTFVEQQKDGVSIQFELQNIMNEIFEGVCKEKPYLEMFICQKCKQLEYGEPDYIVKDFEEKIMRLNRMLSLFEPSGNDKVNQICQYIVQNVDENLNLSNISDRFYLNKNYLCTFLRENIGIKFTLYCRRVKIERAKKLLNDTNMCIYEIADKLHFKDADYFSRLFKIETGVSPTEYIWYSNDDIIFKHVGETQKKDTEIKVGIMGNYTGEYAYLDGGKRYVYEYAARVINNNGGICGRMLRLIFVDEESTITGIEDKTQRLIDENVSLIIGGFMSSARELIRPVIDKNAIPYFYDSLYEGGLADHYTFCFSSMPEQNIKPALDYFVEAKMKKFYILATDYNYGILSAEYSKKYIVEHDGEVVALEYVPLTKNNFAITIENIVETAPDVVISFLVGERQSAFFKQWHEKTGNVIPIISTSVISQGYMHLHTEEGVLENLYFSSAYTEELESKESYEWKNDIRKHYKMNEIPYLGSDHEAAYLTLLFYKMAVEKYGSTDTEHVIHALESDNISLIAPGGIAEMNPKDHHLIRDVCVYRVNKSNQVELVRKVLSVKSEFVESVLRDKYNVQNGLRQLGKKSPNIQYNSLIYKI